MRLDRHAWAVAHILIDNFGTDAALHAATRAREAAVSGHADDIALWALVLEAVEELLCIPDPAVGAADPEVLALAEKLIKAFGRYAGPYAAERAARLQDIADAATATKWLTVEIVIDNRRRGSRGSLH